MHTEEGLRLSGAEDTGRETGGLMLSINGLHNFYYLPELHDMCCKAQHIAEIIRGRYHRDPLNSDVYMFMSGGEEELQARTEQLERMNVRLDEIMDELKQLSHKIDNLTGLLEKAKDRADKASLESEMHQKENIELKKIVNKLQQRLNLMNSRVFGPSKSQKGIEKKKPVRGKHDDKDD